jgi:hypothetical protein
MILWHVEDLLIYQIPIHKILTPLSIPSTRSNMSLLVGLPESFFI